MKIDWKRKKHITSFRIFLTCNLFSTKKRVIFFGHVAQNVFYMMVNQRVLMYSQKYSIIYGSTHSVEQLKMNSTTVRIKSI